MPEEERTRLIEAEWETPTVEDGGELYLTEVCIYANNRTGVLLDISKAFMELQIDIKSLETRVNKRNTATIRLSFETKGVEQLGHIIAKLKNIESVFAVERTAG